MTIGGKKAILLLLLGDVAAFAAALWLAMALRALALPRMAQFYNELKPFCVLFAIWVLIFYVAGLYSKSSILFRSRMVGAIFNTHLANIIIAALFFFAIPYFGVTPKLVLVIYLVISLGLIYLWRLVIFPRVSAPGRRERTAIIGAGEEVEELTKEINDNPRYPLRVDMVEDPASLTAAAFPRFIERMRQAKISLLVVDIEHKALREVQPLIYDLVLTERRARFIDLYDLYEVIFDRVPLSLLNYSWFLDNLTHPASNFYLALKRIVDIAGALVMGAVTIILIPLLYIAMLIDDRGPLFLKQERIGTHGGLVRAYKFRSMRFNKTASSEWTVEEREQNPVTRVGTFLRRTSLDEFPQFLNILTGQLSLVGPRNDIAGLGMRLAQAIPYYNLRYAVKPGITGWAQINQQYEQGHISPQSVTETKIRLAYDFYYLKNRSLALDFIIMLRTLKRMFFRISSL